jgi:hypothetical protein
MELISRQLLSEWRERSEDAGNGEELGRKGKEEMK